MEPLLPPVSSDIDGLTPVLTSHAEGTMHLPQGDGGWHRLQMGSGSEQPTPRGWFAACATAPGLLVHGGNSPSNERLSDMYLLDLHSL